MGASGQPRRATRAGDDTSSHTPPLPPAYLASPALPSRPLCCRFRPLNSIETRENSKIIVNFDENKKTLNLTGEAVALAGAEKVSPPRFNVWHARASAAQTRMPDSCLANLPVESPCGRVKALNLLK